MRDRNEQPSPNPDFCRPSPEEPYGVRLARDFQFHRTNNSMGAFYELYPHLRPAGRDESERPKGRSR